MNPLVESIGLEFEVAQVPKEPLREIARMVGWRLVEDGSCRTTQRVLYNIPVAAGGRRAVFGGELVSPIIDTSEGESWKDSVSYILDKFRGLGEGLDLRTGIHVHINCTGLPLFAIHNILRIGLYLEAAMYRLACAEMGVHRGSLHLDHAYARPISRYGPPITNMDNTPRPIFAVEKLLNARSMTELYTALGRLDNWGGGKYHEARYVWLNLVTLFRQGSIEFRLFNSTYRARNVFAWIEVCKSMVRLAFGKGGFGDANPLGTSQITFEDVIESLMIEDSATVYILEDLWNQASYQTPLAGMQWGHLRQSFRWGRVPKRLCPPVITNTEDVIPFEEFKSTVPIFCAGAIPLSKET